MSKKWVYLFTEGDASMRDLLGGKGAGVSEMTRTGVPVPPGFTITTEACNAFYESGKQFPTGMWEQALEALKQIEKQTGKTFGDPANPLLVSVRSGAKFSMPGMMDTVLNLGLNRETLEGLANLTGNRRFAQDAYRRFVQLFGKIVLGVDGEKLEHVMNEAKGESRQDTDLSAEELAADHRALQGDHQGGRQGRLPGGPLRATEDGDRRRVQLLDGPPCDRLPPAQQDPRQPGYWRQCADDGVRQYGRR